MGPIKGIDDVLRQQIFVVLGLLISTKFCLTRAYRKQNDVGQA
jgi:hypothetical protein